MQKTAEILCVGTELLLGDIINTNAAFLARELSALGIFVYHQAVVGDNPARLREAVEQALSRSDMLFVTGGLGPTYDDLTKETICEVLQMPLEMDEEAMAAIESFFARLGRPMTENNRKQALIPRGGRAITNNYGTAPGIWVEKNGKTAILLPGPPKEMEPMFLEEVAPCLRRADGKVLVSRNLQLFGIGESALEDRLRSRMENAVNPTIAPYAKSAEVRLRVTASAENEAEAEKLLAPVVGELAEELKDYLYGIDVDSLAAAAVAALREKGLTAAAAESCTGGLIAKNITDIPGSSAVFGYGAVTYCNEAKMKLLGVRRETIAQFTEVSEQAACEMAEGVRRLADADIGVATTGIAGPDGGTEENPVGTVWLGLATREKNWAIRLQLGSGRRDQRDRVRLQASNHALWQIIQIAKTL